MFAVIQFPIADLRAFISDQPLRLKKPDFREPKTFGKNPEFVRYFGRARDRKGDADPAWIDEQAYCNADGALRFVDFREQQLGQTGRPPACYFRRLFSDGEAVNRVEVGIGNLRYTGPIEGLSTQQILEIAASVMELPSKVRRIIDDFDGKGEPPFFHDKLILQGPRLAELFRAATTPKDVREQPEYTTQGSYVEDGRPLLILEFASSEVAELPADVRRVPKESVGGADLAFAHLQSAGAEATPTWLILRGEATEASLRRLRLCLLRLHAEREVLSRVLSQWRFGQIPFSADTDAGKRFMAYLNRATRVVDRPTKFGVQQSAILEAYDAAVSVNRPADQARLTANYDEALLQVVAKAEAVDRAIQAPREQSVTEVSPHMDNVPKPIVKPADTGVIRVDDQDIDRIVEILSNQAANSPVMPQVYFRDLVNRADLPHTWRQTLAGIWTGAVPIDARNLVNWSLAKRINPAKREYTTIGSLLEPLLDDVGLEDRQTIVALITAYQLYLDPAELNTLMTRYGVPSLAPQDGPATEFGPAIDWQGPTETTELQSWFKPVPDFQDVGFLKRAIQRASSVCLVQIPSLHRTGTGFLVAPKLVLTNYHVLKDNDAEDIDAIAKDVVLRFGFLSSTGGDSSTPYEFKLASAQPILRSSATNELDFVLLQVDESILKVTEIQAAPLNPVPLSPGMGLNILQHPAGSPLQLALSSDGVTKVFADSGLVQYVTRAASGSSGAPCFSDDWKVVALHHAQQSRAFGTIREGVLMSAIHSRIQDVL